MPHLGAGLPARSDEPKEDAMNLDRTLLVLLLLLIATALGAVIVLSRRGPAESATHSVFARSALGRIADILTIAAWFGLATGTIHVLLALINRYVRNHFLMAGPQMFWMTPVAYALIFVAIAAVPALVDAVQSRATLRRHLVPVFAGLGVFSLLLPFPQLHKVAGALIATGVGVQIGRAMAHRPEWWLSAMRRTTVRGAIVLVVIAAGTEAWPIAAERYALSRLPAPPANAPNVLLIVLDTVRAESLSLYGYDRPTTPAIERLAHESATFDFAMSTAPWTLKSHGTMFTGKYAEELEGDFEHPLTLSTPVLADEFRKRGYATGGFVANLLYTSRESGLGKGFVHYDDYRLEARQLVLHSWVAQTPIVRSLGAARSVGDLWNAISNPSLEFESNQFNTRTYGRRSGDAITNAFLNWQAAQQQGRPFFAFLNYFDAHGPYRAPREFQKRFERAPNDRQGRYDAAIAYLDSEVERVIKELQNRQLLDNTIVVITSDHGEQFNEHGLNEHSNSLYNQVLHVPLLIRYPATVPQGIRVTDAVTLRDLPSTIADLAHLDGAPFPGAPLAGFWSVNRTNLSGSILRAELSNVIRPEPESPAAFGPMRSVFDQQFHYIRRGDGAEELFNYRADSAETSDLSRTTDGKQRIVELGRLIK